MNNNTRPIIKMEAPRPTLAMYFGTREVVGEYIGHDGKNAYVKSPTGGETDLLVFEHVHDNPRLVDDIFRGNMVKVVSTWVRGKGWHHTLHHTL